MRKICLLFVLALTSIQAMCQADITVQDTGKFVMKRLNDTGYVIVGGDVKLTLIGTYQQHNGHKAFKLAIEKDTSGSIELSYPLNIIDLGDKLTARYDTINSVKVNFSEYSMNQVFLWLYTLNQSNDDGPNIGHLYVGSYTKPEKNGLNDSVRRYKLEQYGTRVKISKQKLTIAQSEVTSFIQNLASIRPRIGSNNKTFNEEFASVEKMVDQYKEKGTMDTADAISLQKAIDTLSKYTSGLQDTVKKIVDIQNLLIKLGDDTLKALKKFSIDTSRLKDIDRKITDLEKQQQNLLAELVKDTAQVNNLKNTISSLNKKEPKNTTEIETESKKLEILTNALTQKEFDLKSLSRQLWYLDLQKHSCEIDIQRSQNDLFKINEKVDGLSSKIADFKNETPNWPQGLTSDSLVTAFSNLLKNAKNGLASYVRAFHAAQELQKQMTDADFFEIEKVSVQFERGHLERVQVWVQNITGGVDIYENIYAIGFTSITNFAAFQSIVLFERKRESKRFIYLSDALPRYDNLLDLYTRDYSPADTVINEYKPDAGPITLRKEQNVNLFESRIFTDLEGFNENKPNGLVQIEVAKRFNLITYRRQVGHFKADFTSLSYLYVYGGITKIEDKQKEFALRNNNTIVNGAIVSPSYISNLDLRRYENLHLGFDVNTFLFDYPTGKFTTYIDFGFRYGHTNLVDTIYNVENGKPVNSKTVNKIDGDAITLTFPKITFELFSQRRVGFSASYSYNRTYAFTHNQYKQVMSYEKSDLNSTVLEKNARGSHIAELFARVETSREGNGQLFLRSRFFWQQGDANTFFSQIQVGYNYNIIFRK